MNARLLPLLVVLAGCPDPKVPDTGDPIDTDVQDTAPPTAPPTPPTPPVDTGLPDPCSALTVWADPAGVSALHPTQLFASGGSGEVTWSLVTNASGGSINAFTGTYLAGETVGVIDVVQADDEVCGLSGTTDVEVLNVLEVEPPGGIVPFGASFELLITGGSSVVECDLNTTAGSSLSGCAYLAGNTEGYDIITVEDPVTGEIVDVGFQVAADSGFAAGVGRIILPLGVSYSPTTVGGSGSVDLIAGSADITVVAGQIVGSTAGRTSLTLRDRYLGDEATVSVDVVAPLVAPEQRDGERSVQGRVVTADIDGDGFTDAMVGSGEVSVGAWFSGAVHVYRGSSTGLEAVPSLTLTIDNEIAYYGADLAVGDFDGDGELDLAVGADFADITGTDSGAVYVYRGVPGGLFETEPTIRAGEFTSDHLGRSVTTCDFNGDGATDLAVGAYAGEDRSLSPLNSNQGAVQIYLGGPFGLANTPDMTVYGKLPEGGVWRDTTNLQLGHRVEAGDWDGDGKCDLFAATTAYAADGAGQDGAVFVYPGTVDGVALEPVRHFMLQTADAYSQFGFRMAAGDADGDGRADLAVGSWNEDTTLGLAGGKVRLFLAANHDGPAFDPVDANAADLTVEGAAYDYVGLGAAIEDIDADGVGELLVSGAYRTNPIALRGGVISAFEGSVTGTVDMDAGVAVTSGDVPYAFYGMAMARTQTPPGYAVLASRDGTYGPEAGAVYWSDGTTNTLLEFPSEASGSQLGNHGTMAWMDMNGDGADDIVGGAYEAAHDALGPSSGHLHVFSGGATLSETRGGHADHASNDRFGVIASPIGDFDGDGFDDLMVLSQRDSKPATFAAPIVNPDACPGSIGATGSAWIFRGSAVGVSSIPSFVYYSPMASDWLQAAVGGLDHNGDGLADVVVGSPIWDVEGGIGVIRGRAANPAGTTVICAADLLIYGSTASSRFGSAIAALGDLDADGCDEFAVGADADDIGRSNQGSVRVIWGGSGVSCPAVPTVSTLVGGNNNDRAGGTLASGEVDGDGTLDLVVGMPLVGGSSGRVAVVRGARIVTLPRDPLSGNYLPDDAVATTTDLVEPGWTRDGNAGSALGHAIAVLDGGQVAIGSPRTGGIEVFVVDGAGLVDTPSMVVAGDGGRAWIGGGILPPRADGTWAVGAPRSDASTLDGGAIYAVPAP